MLSVPLSVLLMEFVKLLRHAWCSFIRVTNGVCEVANTCLVFLIRVANGICEVAKTCLVFLYPFDEWLVDLFNAVAVSPCTLHTYRILLMVLDLGVKHLSVYKRDIMVVREENVIEMSSECGLYIFVVTRTEGDENIGRPLM